eukprot:8215711-Prorocentrum_lima.AAC.1
MLAELAAAKAAHLAESLFPRSTPLQTPDGYPLTPIREHAFRQYSCLYESVAVHGLRSVALLAPSRMNCEKRSFLPIGPERS